MLVLYKQHLERMNLVENVYMQIRQHKRQNQRKANVQSAIICVASLTFSRHFGPLAQAAAAAIGRGTGKVRHSPQCLPTRTTNMPDGTSYHEIPSVQNTFTMAQSYESGDNLCPLCSCIKMPEFAPSWGFEHNSVSDIMVAGQQGCSFCCLLKNALNLISQSDRSVAPETCWVMLKKADENPLLKAHIYNDKQKIIRTADLSLDFVSWVAGSSDYSEGKTTVIMAFWLGTNCLRCAIL